jgi:hypothetical protein
MRTLRLLLVTRAGRLARIGGRHVLRLSHNPATEALYASIKPSPGRLIGLFLDWGLYVSLPGESPGAPSQGGMRRQEAGRYPAASCREARGGHGVHRELESEGLASNLRAVARGGSQANRSATSALIRARSLRAKEIPAERVHTHGVCGRHGGTEERLTWGDLVAFPMKVFMPQLGPKSRRGRPGYKATLKCSAGAQREVRDLVVATTRRESGATSVMTARGVGRGES